MLDLVGNTKDRFSRVTAQIIVQTFASYSTFKVILCVVAPAKVVQREVPSMYRKKKKKQQTFILQDFKVFGLILHH